MADEIQASGAPAGVSARLDRTDWLSFVVTTLLALSIYLFTLAPEVTLDWSGILTTSAMYGGVGPPAGYPVWTIYSWCFIKLLPFSNTAWRVAMGSAVAGALACGLVALMVSRSGKMLLSGMPAFEHLASRERNLIRGICGYAAGMALGFSGRLWNEALIADFETFTVALFALTLYLLIRWMETAHRWFCWLAFFIFGLLLTNSQEMIVALPGLACAVILIEPKVGRDVALVVLPLGLVATSMNQYGLWLGFFERLNFPLLIVFSIVALLAIAAAIRTRGIASEWKSALVCGLCLLLGLAAYLYLPVASATTPPVNWAYSRTAEGFVHLVSRGQFEHPHPTNSFPLFTKQLWSLTKQIGQEFGWLYLAFATLPFCFLHRITGAGRKWLLGLLAAAACVGPLLLVLVNPAIERQSQELVESYFFPLRVLLALWAGAGLMFFATIAATPGKRRWGRSATP